MKKALLFITSLMLSFASYADGLLRTSDLKQYCAQEGVNRQTIVYLDQSIISKTDPNWYKDILNKTHFLPGERVQVVTINDGGSTVELVWDTCFPSYTKAVYKQKKAQEGMAVVFTGGVDDQLKNDQKIFNQRIKQALAHPLAGSRHETAPHFEASNFPNKKLVEAFYYDANRTRIDNGIARVIVFSDMIEKSDLVNHSSFNALEAATSAAERFPVFFNHASFFVYGINYSNNETKLNESMEKFWRNFMIYSGAEIAHYGTQLVLPSDNQLFTAKSYKGKLTQSNGKELATQMRLAYTPEGELKYSWLAIGDKYMTLKGTISCSGKNCKVDAQIKESSFDGFKARDALLLNGDMSSLSGTLGARDDSVIDETGKVYRFNVSYTQEARLGM
ncbi:hypothetical protein J8L70_02955 [Pseudoalteromonas sp. MMG010]|uniref:hypothetical protein n=1 Tax=Pseudoalteromonas sp. MMG010 TaxID=2822685 RepID=UPI001B3A35A3|nr:hypothetical protein [Pseudoalteromonas sp. MMG010]MBQ4832190.1 hypothetical protein [Pseudoalteromonas sp. MMG010]